MEKDLKFTRQKGEKEGVFLGEITIDFLLKKNGEKSQ